MQFRITSRTQQKKFKKQLFLRVAQGKLSRKVTRREYIRQPYFKHFWKAYKETVFPGNALPYFTVAAVAVIVILFFHIVTLKGNIADLNRVNNDLSNDNYKLSDNINFLNEIIAQKNASSKLQQETISSQAQSIIDIENLISRSELEHSTQIEDLNKDYADKIAALEEQIKALEQAMKDLEAAKDESIQKLVDYINNYDIFGRLLYNSADLYAASSQVSAAKKEIQQLFGDSKITDTILTKLNSEGYDIAYYLEHYPDYCPTRGWVTDVWGMRLHPLEGIYKMHEGLDIANGIGTPIYATAGGKVIFAGWNRYGSGYKIEIDHGNGFITTYSHLDKISVSVGQTVTKYSKIGTMGDTGNVTGPHLHFEIWLNGKSVDPLNYISYPLHD